MGVEKKLRHQASLINRQAQGAGKARTPGAPIKNGGNTYGRAKSALRLLPAVSGRHLIEQAGSSAPSCLNQDLNRSA